MPVKTIDPLSEPPSGGSLGKNKPIGGEHMSKKVLVILLSICLLCMGGCKKDSSGEPCSHYLRYNDFSSFTEAIQEYKQKNDEEKLQLDEEELFLANLKDLAYPKDAPEGYSLSHIKVWNGVVLYEYIPVSMEHEQNSSKRYENAISFIYRISDDPNISYFEGYRKSTQTVPTEDGVLFIENLNEVVKAVGNNIFSVRSDNYKVKYEYQTLLSLCEYQLISYD